MRKLQISIPQLALVAATRGILGAGVGLLLSSRVPLRRRRQVGMALATFGALSTIPLAIATARAARRRRARMPMPTEDVEVYIEELRAF